MSVRAIAAIILCKLLRRISRLLHRGGTAMPGRYALRLCPELLSIVSRGVRTIAVTGTNGKTTSARMIEQAFIDRGMSYFANRSGANLISGITTEFVMNCSLSGKCRKSYAVIECDEAAAKQVFRQMRPEVVVVTNLFKDQVDRFSDATVTLENIRTALRNSPDSIVCLNADCSLTSHLAKALPNRVVYFGMDASACEKKVPENNDAGKCLDCGGEYAYDYVSYGHLGGFYCPRCGYRRHEADYAVTDILSMDADSSSVVMRILGEKKLVSINQSAMYNIYNAAGAIAGIAEMGLGVQAGLDAAASFKCGFGRMEKFPLGKEGSRMILVKNAAGCNQALEYLKGIKQKFSLVLVINNRTADGTDISWLEDADFEALTALSGTLRHIVVSGDRREEMHSRLIKAGLSESFISMEKDAEALVRWAAEQEHFVCFMPTYTAMLETRQAIIAHCGGEDFWK